MSNPLISGFSLLDADDFQDLVDALRTALTALDHYSDGGKDEPAKSAIATIKEALAAVDVDVEEGDRQP